MRTRRLWFLALPALVLGLAARPGFAQQPRVNPADDAALRKRGEAFVEAFNRGDAKAVASFWTPDADFGDETGRHVRGRKAIEEAYRALFTANKGAKLQITAASTRFVKPDVVVQDGTTEVTPADGGPSTTASFTAVLVKQDGQWLLTSARETEAVPPSNYEHLQELEWLIGDWVDETGKGETASVSYSWADSQNFIVSSSAITLKDIPVAGQTQRIGWDPTAKRVRSWSFHSGGGFSESVWSKDGSQWTIQTTATLRGGKKASATNLLTRVDADHFTWQSTRRSMDGQAVPDSRVIKMKRVP